MARLASVATLARQFWTKMIRSSSIAQRQPTGPVATSLKSYCWRRVSSGDTNGRSSAGKTAPACGPVTMMSAFFAAASNFTPFPLPFQKTMSSNLYGWPTVS